MTLADHRGAGATGVVRAFDAATDEAGLRVCVAAMQDFERGLDPRMPAGRDVAAASVSRLFERCGEARGRIFVLDHGGRIGGYACVLARVEPEEPDEGPAEYGLVAHLLVMEELRGRGYGRKLLQAAEAYASSQGVRWLRIEVLAANVVARDLYVDHGFGEYELELEKELHPA